VTALVASRSLLVRRVIALVRAGGVVIMAGGVLGGCAATSDPAEWLPRGGGDPAAFDALSDVQRDQLALVATNLVSALVQLPETSPANVTLQVSRANSAFGNTILRALEDAGYGLQRVDADQGSHYVAYRQRFAETEAGPVTDYELLVGEVRLQREYVLDETRVFPSSLLTLEGSSAVPAEIVLDDAVFREQGGEAMGSAFISGVRSEGGGPASVREVAVNDFDEQPANRRTAPAEILESARRRRALSDAERGDAALDPTAYERTRRTVLILDDAATRTLGAGNKQAVRLLARDTREGDVFIVTACTDADGRDEASRGRGARVVEEFLGHGLTAEAVRLAPCIRASFRHASDDSPVPVEIVQYRRRLAVQP